MNCRNTAAGKVLLSFQGHGESWGEFKPIVKAELAQQVVFGGHRSCQNQHFQYRILEKTNIGYWFHCAGTNTVVKEINEQMREGVNTEAWGESGDTGRAQT